MRSLYIPSETVNFGYEDSKEIIFGKAYVEIFGVETFVVRFSKDTMMNHDSKWEVNVVVHDRKIIGKGARKYRFAILQAINEFKAGGYDGRN
jgi:hypothetical protein